MEKVSYFERHYRQKMKPLLDKQLYHVIPQLSDLEEIDGHDIQDYEEFGQMSIMEGYEILISGSFQTHCICNGLVYFR